MRKINSNMDNFVDNIFIDISELLCPYFQYFNFTPNMITQINIICSILCLYYLYLGEYELGVLFLVLTYLFDALDGFYARKYKMETHFGDLLDHFTDYIFYLFPHEPSPSRWRATLQRKMEATEQQDGAACSTEFNDGKLASNAPILTWWKEHAARFPYLSQLARRYLAMPIDY